MNYKFYSLYVGDMSDLNPFLDTNDPPIGGYITSFGEPLSRITVPKINTLIVKIGEYTTMLGMSEASLEFPNVGVNVDNIIVRNESIGIQLNLNSWSSVSTERTNSGHIMTSTGQVVGKRIPRNFTEAREMLQFISPKRTGSENQSFDVQELKQIARNLNLATTGIKEVLANRIISAVNEFFGL